MASYTIEDIELIRKKSGISYQEAVDLLDYHNGNVARALIDLENNHKILHEDLKNEKKSQHSGLSSFITQLYRFRVKVNKKDIPILNISLLLGIIAVIISPHLMILAAILCAILGYQITFDKNDPAFAGDNLEKMVRHAAENGKAAVERGFGEFAKKTGNSGAQAQVDSNEEPLEKSYYQGNPASATYHASRAAAVDHSPIMPDVPTIQVPVQVETQEGQVYTSQSMDGYNEATIES